MRNNFYFMLYLIINPKLRFVANSFVHKETFYLNALFSQYLINTTKDVIDFEELKEIVISDTIF